jgi:DNA-binding CsgD family transcriptional regulator
MANESVQTTLPPPPERRSQWLHRWALWWLSVTLLVFAYDIYHDAAHDGVDLHLLLEAVMFIAVTTILIGEWRRNTRMASSLQAAKARSRRLAGEFSDYVRAAFVAWGFSKSEQEIAWLLLKGFTFAEIAAFRSVQEKTVRQQASAIYAKSACKNRNEFLAHFIQDLLESEHMPGEPLSGPGHTAPGEEADGAVDRPAAPTSVPSTSASARAPE